MARRNTFDRAPRGYDQHANMDDREVDLTGAEAAELFDTEDMAWLNALNSDVLPEVKDTDEWHYCWLTTQSQSDTIYKRQQMGYQLVDVEEFPTLSQYKNTGGEHAGKITCNEMVLAKLPMKRYKAWMDHYHYRMPTQDEESIRSQIKGIASEYRDSRGRPLAQFEEGIDDLGRPPPRR